jgi:hypothetical protein
LYWEWIETWRKEIYMFDMQRNGTTSSTVPRDVYGFYLSSVWRCWIDHPPIIKVRIM